MTRPVGPPSWARSNGPDYLYHLLTSYKDPPEGVKVPDGQYYNEAFPGHFLACLPVLIKDMYGRTLTGKQKGHSPADSTSASGYKGGFIFQTKDHTCRFIRIHPVSRE